MATLLAGGLQGVRPILSSPLRRCRETAAALADRWAVEVEVESRLAEMPSPEGVAMGRRVAWLRAASASTWAELGPRYTRYRDDVVDRLVAIPTSTVVVTHFFAINAVIGVATGDDRTRIRSVDNCSVTVVDLRDGAMTLVEGGREADTLIR
jgi:broad specificity phosphatase PhoE